MRKNNFNSSYFNKYILFAVMHSFSFGLLGHSECRNELCQNIIINNRVAKTATCSRCNCVSNYNAIKTVLDKYFRPFTLLDIGAGSGYYSFRAAHDYDCVCVMIESRDAQYSTGVKLLDLCELNYKLRNIILLEKKISLRDLKRLSECENFDVVLLLNFLEKFGEKWKEAIDIALNMGDHVIVEVDFQDKEIKKDIEKFLISKGASQLFSNIYLLRSTTNFIRRKMWIRPILPENSYSIKSSFKEKFFTKMRENISVTSKWIPGLNLVTFKMYNGVYPEKEDIKNIIKKLSHIRHNDWMPNNMILQGKNIKFIDFDDPRIMGEGLRFSKGRLNKILEFIDEDDTNKLVKLYFECARRKIS